MTYAQMLDAMIIKSELSLRQIAKRCAEFNVSITPSYISQLKNAKLPPASEEVTLALAQVCGEKNTSFLIFQGYLEKAPKLMQNYIFSTADLSKKFIASLVKDHHEVPEEYQDYIDSLDVISSLELSEQHVNGEETASISELVDQMKLATGGFTKDDAGKESVKFFLTDTSMAPLIPVNSFLYIMPTRRDWLKNRDVIAFYPPASKTLVIRRFFEERGRILLLPEDRNFPIFTYDSIDELNYFGKAMSYRCDL